jgi:hypothetical protein
MRGNDRRAFFRRVLGAAGAALAKATPASPNERQQQATQIRQQAAAAQGSKPYADHATNGDETSLPGYVACFTKGLPHMQAGEVQPSAYEALLHALSTGKQADFESLDRGSGMKLVNPQASYAFQLEGADSHCFGMPPPPAFRSAEAAGETVELYWQALMRDVPFSEYDTSPVAQTAAQELTTLSAFDGPKAGGRITTATLFRGNVSGGLDGPYISQFLWKPIPMNSSIVDQRYRQHAPGVDYLTTWPEWLELQSGLPPFRDPVFDPTPRYIYNGRALAEWVHYDFLYQAFHNAALILLNQGPETILNKNPYLSPANPYKNSKVETGFGTFGAPHI